MYCPFCGGKLEVVKEFCNHCGKNICFLPQSSQQNEVNSPATNLDFLRQSSSSSLQTFLNFRRCKRTERVNSLTKRKTLKIPETSRHPGKVQISVGIVERGRNGKLKKKRGRNLPLMVDEDLTAVSLLRQAKSKILDFNKDIENGSYILLYPDFSRVDMIPGTSTNFTLKAYKEALGKPYSGITFYICLLSQFEDIRSEDSQDSNSSDSVVIVRKNNDATLDSTLEWEGTATETAAGVPGKERLAPNDNQRESEAILALSDSPESELPSTSQEQTDCYRQYTSIFTKDICNGSSSSDDEVAEVCAGSSINSDPLTVEEVIANLSTEVKRDCCSKFYINRNNVWESALITMKRKNFRGDHDVFVKFSDDSGVSEPSIDVGGPKREFFTLCLESLHQNPMFEGPAGRKTITLNPKALKKDEYFMAGQIMAISIVNGGPGPAFFSSDFFNNVIGRQTQKTVLDIADETVREILEEIQSATTLTEARELCEKHSAMLSTAGCFRFLQLLEEKNDLVSDYVEWYLFTRNHAAIHRFKEGLSTLNVLSAMESHPDLFFPIMCHADKAVTALSVDRAFRRLFSPMGSNRRREETQVATFWGNFLNDVEDKEIQGLSLEDILMFGTGLRAFPPAGFHPLPSLEFFSSSSFPTANTCANVIHLPLCHSYEEFCEFMQFGIKNSPGFGLY